MGRKAARTVEYFPHFVKFGKTLYLIEEKWGNDGYAFWFKLLQILGSATDHFLDCCADTVPGRENWDYLTARMRFPAEKCSEIISWLAERGNIDTELWTSHRIIWCQEFVDNLSEVYAHRSNPVPKRPCNGISKVEMQQQGDFHGENGPSTGISGDFSPIGRKEGKEGREGITEDGDIRGGNRNPPPSSASPSYEESLRKSSHAPTRVDAPPAQENPMIIELLQIHKAATGVDLAISDEEMRDLLAIFRKHDGPTVVAAYKLCQTKKPGKPMRFFLDDFALYYAECQKSKPATPVDPGPECPECGLHGGKHVQGCAKAKPPAESSGEQAVDNFEDDIPFPEEKEST